MKQKDNKLSTKLEIFRDRSTKHETTKRFIDIKYTCTLNNNEENEKVKKIRKDYENISDLLTEGN